MGYLKSSAYSRKVIIVENKPIAPPPNGNQKRLFFWFYLVILFFLVTQGSLTGTYRTTETNWNDLENKMLAEEDIAQMIVVNKERVEITLKSEPLAAGKYPDFRSNSRGPHYFLTIGSVEAFESRLLSIQDKHDLAQLPEVRYVTRTNWLRSIFSWLLPFIIIIAIWYYIFARIGRRGGMGSVNPFDFGKSRATLFDDANQSKHSFEDVAGLEEAKAEIQEIVEFLKNPDRYTYLGAKIPKGVILVGPPGTGKTLLAKAVAGEAQVPFFHLSGSEFVEMFVGVGASRVRDLFRKAKDKSPSIIFIDELDAIGRARGNSLSMRANDERESTLNQLLTEMDGFGTNTGVIVMAATNRADILDKALLRPGRFDRHIYLELPNLEERKAIFEVHLKPLRLAKDIDVELLAGQTPGFSGADIANICNEAALIAARQRKEAIDMQDFSSATDRIIAGLEKKSKIISKEEKRIIAFHEAGHATVSWFLEHGDELMKVSIVPRGKSLGSAWYLPEEHQLFTKGQLTDKLCMALGGRAAEDLIFNEISSGALDDLEKVTKQAYSMVAFYGLDEKLGHISFYDSTGQSDQSLHRPYSEATAQIIDEEVRNLVNEAYQKAIAILKDHRTELESLAGLLLDQEVANRDDLVEIFGERDRTQPQQALLANG